MCCTQAATCFSWNDFRDIAKLRLFIEETTRKIPENSSTAHDRFRPSTSGSSGWLSPRFSVLLKPKLDCFREIHTFANQFGFHDRLNCRRVFSNL
ncbi:hypothetical protein T265_14782, partial [Opisthorchis viverrini]